MTKSKRLFGVKIFLQEIHVFKLEEDSLLSSPEYKYIVTIDQISEKNGNGTRNLNFYTNGELKIIEKDNWRISPIIKMSYIWIGYTGYIEVSDVNNQIMTEEFSYNYTDCTHEKHCIRKVIQFIDRLDSVYNLNHLKLLDTISLKESKSNFVEILNISSQKMIEETTDLHSIINQYTSLSTELPEKYKTQLKSKVNNLINTFNDNLRINLL